MRAFLFPLAFAVMASPALAHQDDHHGLPGVAHPFSADHLGWAILAAVVLIGAMALRRPLLRAIRARTRR